MIKAITTKSTKGYKSEVTVEGTGVEVMNEFLGILNALESECPALLIEAIKQRLEDK